MLSFFVGEWTLPREFEELSILVLWQPCLLLVNARTHSAEVVLLGGGMLQALFTCFLVRFRVVLIGLRGCVHLVRFYVLVRAGFATRGQRSRQTYRLLASHTSLHVRAVHVQWCCSWENVTHVLVFWEM